MINSDAFLDLLAPADAWMSDWPDVLERARTEAKARRVTKRRVVIAFVVLVAVLVPLVALAGANDWWFLRSGIGPTPAKTPVVVKDGVWSGHAWQLVAYPSTTDGLCLAVVPKNSASQVAGGMNCSPFEGIARTSSTKTSPDMTITYLMSSASSGLPAYIAGPVIDKASTVTIRFSNGAILHLPTFAARGSLSSTRFYAAPLTGDVLKGLFKPPQTGGFTPPLHWLAGLDTQGKVVACLAPRAAQDGISPLSACH
jgi:hypothetical protein